MSGAALIPYTSTVTLLIVSPDEQDHLSLRRILEPQCELHRASGRQDAAQCVKMFRPEVVICEDRLADGDWRDLLNDLRAAENTPRLIVTSRLADDRLWAEVLNLGGCDVLTKPFAEKEVSHAVKMAAHRQNSGDSR